MSPIDPRIADYVRQVSEPGVPYISYSHKTLWDLYYIHGKDVINNLLTEHWARQREQHKQVPPALLRINKEINDSTNQ